MVDATRIVGAILLVVGISLLASEFFLRQTLLLVLGTGTTFLGVYATAMSTERYVKADTLAAGFAASMDNLERVIGELGISGKAVFLPKKYVGEPRVFVPAKDGEVSLPDLRGDPTFLTGTEAGEAGVLLFPPGHKLCSLLEDELGNELEALDAAAVATLVPPLLCHGFGLAASMEIDEGKPSFKVASPVTSEFYARGLRVSRQIGCPICSCVIEALSRSLDLPLRVESVSHDAVRDFVAVTLSKVED